jgi:thiol:disulfide interchange protein
LNGADPKQVVVKGSVRIQICKAGTCLQPTDFPFEAHVVDAPPAEPSVVEFTHPDTHATIRGYLEPGTAAPGSTAKLVLSAEMPPGWHVYAAAEKDANQLGSKPTLIALGNTSGFAREATQPDKPPVEAPAPVAGLPPQRYYEGRVTWTVPLVIPKDTKPGTYPIEGIIGYQTCFEDQTCDAPRGAAFSGTLTVGSQADDKASALTFTAAKYGDAARLAAQQPAPVGPQGTAEPQLAQAATGPWTLVLTMLAGLAGGFILNFMPCVLPVIGLKVLSFAEQAGRSRAQILLLNVWYSLGTLLVFMVLATLASSVALGLGSKDLNWGEQFGYTSFNIVMVGIVFTMALSFLGVWEIPIPGFVGSGAANDLAAREGAAGAFAKGVMATILATPCSGPALGPVFGYTLQQSPVVTYLLFACIALGMSAPYLLIGAFPKLIRFLPKPGAWMETFKQAMGFVLLGTIVFLFSFMDPDYLVPTFAMMVGLWAACWWIGRTSLTESFGRKLRAWTQGAVFAGVVTLASFTWLVPHASKIPWQTFSQAELARLTGEGNTVLVEFTADWCLTCKTNLLLAIETDEVRTALADNKVVPLLADWTKPSPEIESALAALKSRSIPLLAIYPAGRPNDPIILRDLITKQQLLSAIKSAGPSDAKSQLTASR